MAESPMHARLPREPRYPYRGTMRIMVPFAPWRILISANALNLSSTGVAALLPTNASDAEALLQEGDPYELQLEHDSEELPTPFLQARLARRERTRDGLEVAFSFEAPDVDLMGMVHELSQVKP